VWLGDGHCTAARFTTIDPEIVAGVEADGFLVRPSGPAAEVFDDKHIPAAYLRASEEQRRALLAGLLDTDGTVTNGGQPQFTTTSSRLAEGVHELVVGLGYRASVVTKAVKGRSEDTRPATW
jgi:replicative DNA helicase